MSTPDINDYFTVDHDAADAVFFGDMRRRVHVYTAAFCDDRTSAVELFSYLPASWADSVASIVSDATDGARVLS